MKYRIYIDEVGNSDLGSSGDNNHRYLALTGIVIDLEYVKTTFAPDVEALKQKYFNSHPDNPVIFHRKEMVNKKYPFKSLIDPDVEKAFNDDFLQLLAKWPFRTITAVIDKQEHNTRYSVWRYDPYHYCMAVIFERYHLRLKGIKQKGDMMIEARGGKEDMRLEESYSKIFTQGTEYIRAQDIDDTLTSKELKVKPKSANVAGLQIADLLAYPLYRYTLQRYGKLNDGRDTFNEKIIEVIKPKILHGGNRIEGYGINLLP